MSNDILKPRRDQLFEGVAVVYSGEQIYVSVAGARRRRHVLITITCLNMALTPQMILDHLYYYQEILILVVPLIGLWAALCCRPKTLTLVRVP